MESVNVNQAVEKDQNKFSSFFKTALNLENMQPTGNDISSETHQQTDINISKKASSLNQTSTNVNYLDTAKGKSSGLMQAILQKQRPTLVSTPEKQSETQPASSDQGSSSNSNIFQLLAMRRLGRTVKNIQNERQRRLENTGNESLDAKVRKFNSNIAVEHMNVILERYLKNMSYDCKHCSKIALILSDVIRDSIKELKYPRYKFICMVTIGQFGTASLAEGSRCLWDSNNDNYACAHFQNNSLFAVATLYAVFLE